MPPIHHLQNNKTSAAIVEETVDEKRYWAGCNIPSCEAPDISIFGLPYDGAACFRAGAREGPARIRRLSAEIPSVLETGESFASLAICDEGDLFFEGDFVAAHPEIASAVSKRLGQAFSLTLGEITLL